MCDLRGRVILILISCIYKPPASFLITQTSCHHNRPPNKLPYFYNSRCNNCIANTSNPNKRINAKYIERFQSW